MDTQDTVGYSIVADVLMAVIVKVVDGGLAGGSSVGSAKRQTRTQHTQISGFVRWSIVEPRGQYACSIGVAG